MRALMVLKNDDKGVVVDRKFYIITEDKAQAVKFVSHLSQLSKASLVDYIKTSLYKQKEKSLLWKKFIVIY